MPELVLDWNKYREAAISAAAEGIVMLRNEGEALPLKRGSRVALFGRMQTHYYKSGTGSGGMVNVSHVTDIREGLASSPSITLDPELMDIYDKWDNENPTDEGLGWGQEAWSQVEMPVDPSLAETVASRNDAAVIIIARTAGEDRDNTPEKGSYYLSDSEEAMLAAVSAAFERTIVLLNVGNIIDMSFVAKYDIKSVLYVWQGGMIGGSAVARIVTGEVNPSGCLTDTIAASLSDYPSNDNFGNKDIHEDIYEEDIFVGYRYFSTFAPSKVLYPFGFGLSYTSFELKVTGFVFDGKNVKVTADVENTGDVPGKKAVMLYASAPQGKLSKPARVLVGFAKTGVISVGGNEQVEITAPIRAFASYDDDGRTGLGTGFILDAGHYSFYLGGDVTTDLEAGSFDIDAPLMVEAVTNAMGPTKAFKRMTAVPSDNGFVQGYEDVPLLKEDHLASRLSIVPSEIAQTGDKGIKLSDVKHGKNTLDEFIAQLSDEDLCLIIRGEGMGSFKATIGTAAAFGGISKELMEMGVPTLCCSDGPSGMRIDSGKKAFSLPNGTCLASTFNVDIVEELYTYLGIEMISNKIDSLLGPGINIHRHPLNGRNFEYFSEDPLLTGLMACAQVRAFEKNGVTPTIKHLCGNNRETKRRESNSVISERALREIYLPAFEIAVREGGARSIMTSYNRVNGIYSANNYDMNTIVLREQWGYTGIVMSDWWAFIGVTGGDTAEHSLTDHSVMARSQNDIYMVCSNVERKCLDEADTYKELTEGDGSRITRAELQRNAANILRFAMNTPAMDRICGNAAEIKHIDDPFKDDDVSVDPDMVYDLEDELVIDRPEKTWADRDFVFGVTPQKQGFYEMEMIGSCELNSLAQVPMQMYISSIPFAVVTWNGTDGKDISLKNEVLFLTRNGVMRIHFSAPGVKLKKLILKYTRPFTEPEKY
ncbi:MAG: beta-glucosidase [Ruminococcaceae bacterium]|nr:beta-glucosidase [Oscillospiraceae bacterium]